VQVGTANYLDPTAAGSVVEGMIAYAGRHGVRRIADLIGALDVPGS
jgi:dihydroorotate dehydrogenase (NAD+) catalytic subunit